MVVYVHHLALPGEVTELVYELGETRLVHTDVAQNEAVDSSRDLFKLLEHLVVSGQLEATSPRRQDECCRPDPVNVL